MAQKRWAVAASAPCSSSFCCGGCSATSGFSSSDPPTEGREGDAAGRVDPHALALQSKPLRDSGARAFELETELALRVDHTMPRHSRSSRQRAEGVADEPRLPRKAGKTRDRAVRRYAPFRNLSDDRVD